MPFTNINRNIRKPFVYYLALWGCLSTGIVYLAIGIVALLSFFRLRQGGADEASLLVYLDQYIAGKILVWIVLLGMAAFVAWRIYELVKDPYEYGSSVKAKLPAVESR